LHPPPRYPAGAPLPPPPEAYRSLLTSHHPPRRERYALHIALFVATALAMIWAGGTWAGRAALWEAEGWGLWLDPAFLADGFRYTIPFLFFLTVHEFGHYLMARRHRVDVSLPYFIPIPPGVPILNIGTFGAVIRIRQVIPRTRELFDIGVAGPLAGFAVALGALALALITLPPPTYVFDLGLGHEAIQEYVRQFGTFPTEPPRDAFGFGPLAVGTTPLFAIVEWLTPGFPPAWELYHYPVLFAAWLGLFFTALNLLPVGQLDGGHVTYALFGPVWHAWIARATLLGLLFLGSLGAVGDIGEVLRLTALEYGYPVWAGAAATWAMLALILLALTRRAFLTPFGQRMAWLGVLAAVAVADAVPGAAEAMGWLGWLLWGALIVYVIKVDHPPVPIQEPLSPGRRALGVLALVIFVLCFSPRPLYLA
jgi:membrane-associated protease RseP (regulator of RpoE activity)